MLVSISLLKVKLLIVKVDMNPILITKEDRVYETVQYVLDRILFTLMMDTLVNNVHHTLKLKVQTHNVKLTSVDQTTSSQLMEHVIFAKVDTSQTEATR